MSVAKISQREARNLKRRVAHLEQLDRDRRNAYAREYPRGIHVTTIGLGDVQYAKLEMARRLGFALIGTTPNSGQMEIYAIPSSE